MKLNKKNILLAVIILLSFNNVYAESCNGLLTQEAAELIVEIINIIRIGVPILLIILCSTDLVSIVTGQDEKIVKVATGRIIKRFIAAAAFFFVPLIVSFVLEIDAVKNSLNLVDDPLCGIDDGSIEGDGYQKEEDVKTEYEEKEEENNSVKNDDVYKNEPYHDNSINGVRYILYNQTDSRWKNIKYNNTTFGAEGCAVTSSAVIISAHDPLKTPGVVVKTNAHSYPCNSVKDLAGESFDCYKGAGKVEYKKLLAEGKVLVIRVQGRNKGGNNKFVPGNHYMALIDYDKKNNKIFVGNSFSNSKYGKSGWFDADDVLTSVVESHVCTPKQSLIDKFK